MKNLNIYKLFLPSLRKIPFSITADNDDFLSNIKNKFNFSYKIASLNGDETAIITFTSGSTGVPKGIERSHNSLVIQMEYLKKILNFSEDDIEMTNLPLFVLNSIANRIKVVLPYIKNYKLKDIEPSIIWKEIREMNVNRLTGSPFFIEKIMNMVEKENLIKKIFTGGGIVSSFLVKRLVDLNIDVNIVYGSTEAEPISIINGREIIKDEEKEGVNIGIPIEDIELKIIKIEKSNSIIDFTKSDKSNFIVENGKIGEIIVKGKNVNRSYFKDINAILYNKIKDIDGEVYHRTGDTGFIGKNGNLYITGRKDFSIILNNEVLNTFYIQNRLNRIKGVKKSAIIQDKKGKIYIFIEKEKKSRKKLIISDIKKIIDFDFSIRFLKRIPLDKRHNTKIDYGKLLKLL